MKLREVEKMTNGGIQCPFQPAIQPVIPAIVFMIPYGYMEAGTQVTALR
jgi:hypothetical protein